MSRSPRRLSLLGLLVALPLAARADQPPRAATEPAAVKTGYWIARTHWLGVATIRDKWCVDRGDLTQFLSGPSNHVYACAYPGAALGANKTQFAGVCRNGERRFQLRGQGTFTATTLHAAATASGAWFGVPVSGLVTHDAHFVSAVCPSDAKRF